MVRPNNVSPVASVDATGEAPPAAEEDEFDPDDKRPLYERLKAQKDAKEEEFQYNSAFKNQMDHWRLDEDEAAFEDERLAKFQQCNISGSFKPSLSPQPAAEWSTPSRRLSRPQRPSREG